MTGRRCAPRRCPYCKATLETPKTPQNPKGKLQPYTLAGCPHHLSLQVLDATLRPTLSDMLTDEETWNTMVNSSPEMKAWVDARLTKARLQGAAEVIADCFAARAWAATRDGRYPSDTATLGRFRRCFDPETGYNTASQPIQDRARWLLHQWRKHAGEWTPPVPGD